MRGNSHVRFGGSVLDTIRLVHCRIYTQPNGAGSRPYYLNIIKEMFFFLSNYKFKNLVGKINNILNSNDNYINFYNGINITNSSYISITISTITMIILLFIVDSQT